MYNFTKGKWTASRFGDEAKVVCNVTQDISIYTDADCVGCAKADATLISSAPDMLNLLLELQTEGGLGIAKRRRIQRVIDAATGK